MKTLEIEKNEFLKTSSSFSNSIFLSNNWIESFDNLKFYKIITDDEIILAIFYLRFQKKTILNTYRTPFYTPHLGLWIDNKSKNKSNLLTSEKKIITEIANFLDSKKMAVISIAFPTKNIDMQPFIWNNFKVIPNYTYEINLDQSTTEILNSMSPERRNDLKKAKKDNIVIKKGTDLSVSKLLIDKSLNRTNSNNYNSYINKILFNFANDTNSFAFVSYLNEVPIATSFCVFDKEKAYYLLGGYDNEIKHSGAGALCIWESILYAKELGIKKFDFEGSMIKPVESYFRGFGGDLTPYYTINKAPVIIELVLKFFYRSTF